MKVLIVLAAVAMTTPAWSQAPPPHISIVVNPDYARPPTDADIASVYPPAALKARLPGKAHVHCNLSDEGKLEECIVLSEEPAGQGFGDAAIAFLNRVGFKPLTRDGVPQLGYVDEVVPFSPP